MALGLCSRGHSVGGTWAFVILEKWHSDRSITRPNEVQRSTVCWKAARDTDTASKEQWLAAKRAEEQQTAAEWAEKFDMPPLEGPDKALDWGQRSRHQLMAAAHTALVIEGAWDEADWAELEEKARLVTRAGWWIDQRDADGSDLLELLDAASEADRGTENPFR
ncbi:hypothetical protein [Streptomyces hygroscopicus]|uniref:hypothetical protein n=1 Tax=Streptomyces hygroscopicus TaxID=1912 RepID=UPI00206D6A38|nr:hypothetical protein HOK021_66110 [Streptomyces hygroscopicus]